MDHVLQNGAYSSPLARPQPLLDLDPFANDLRNYYDVRQRSCFPKIQKDQRSMLMTLLQPKNVVQVCGALLVGKSTFVKETLKELLVLRTSQNCGNNIIQHHMNCKGISSFSSVLAIVFQELEIAEPPNELTSPQQIKAALRDWLKYWHIFVFHKCEGLKNNQEHFNFLDFLCELSDLPNITVVFTSYKLFPQHFNIHTLEISMLSNNSDIESLLHFYSCGNSHAPTAAGYVELINRYNLCFPLAVRHFADMLNVVYVPAPEQVEKYLQRHLLKFYELCLGHRLKDIDKWLHIDKLKWIIHFVFPRDTTFSDDHLLNMTVENEPYGWNQMRAYLREHFVLSTVPGLDGRVRLRYHPLVVLYFNKLMSSHKLLLEGDWFNQSCDNSVKFLCGVLDRTEMLSRGKGNKFALFTCLLPEWCNMRNAIQMAIYRKDYKAYWKIATMAANFLIKWSTEEAIYFFQAMYDSACQNGYRSRKETAILEGHLAYAIAQGKNGGNPLNGYSWELSLKHFNSALQALEGENCGFHKAQILCNLAHMLGRRGEYQASTRTFNSSLASIQNNDDYAVDEFYVSEWQIEALTTTVNTLKTIPQIFLGHNKEALVDLQNVLQDMEDNKLYHIEYPTVLNMIGLAEQRSGGNMNRAISFYSQAIQERMHLMNVCPQDLVVPYNNFAMLISYETRDYDRVVRLLNKALDIRRQQGWMNYNTALTLIHLGDIHYKLEKHVSTLRFYSQANEILTEISKTHDLRQRLILSYAHTLLAIDQKFSRSENNIPSVCQCVPPGSSSTGSGFSCHGISRIEAQTCHCNCKQCLDNCFPLRKPAKMYFEEAYKLAMSSVDTLSDQGHNQMLTSLEHLILMELGNPDRILFHVERIRDIMEKNAWVVKELGKPDDQVRSFLNDHNKFYKYVSKTEPSELDMKKLFTLMMANCGSCRSNQNYFSESSWEKIISLCQNKNKKLSSQTRFSESRSDNFTNIRFPAELPALVSDMSKERLTSEDLYMRLGKDSVSSLGIGKDSVSSLGIGKDSVRSHGIGDIDSIVSCINATYAASQRKCTETTHIHVKDSDGACVVVSNSDQIFDGNGGNKRYGPTANEDNLPCGSEFTQGHHRRPDEASWKGQVYESENDGYDSVFGTSVNACPNIPVLSQLCDMSSWNVSNPVHQEKLPYSNGNLCLKNSEVINLQIKCHRSFSELRQNGRTASVNNTSCMSHGNGTFSSEKESVQSQSSQPEVDQNHSLRCPYTTGKINRAGISNIDGLVKMNPDSSPSVCANADKPLAYVGIQKKGVDTTSQGNQCQYGAHGKKMPSEEDERDAK